jgi:hypothetical protein
MRGTSIRIVVASVYERLKLQGNEGVDKDHGVLPASARIHHAPLMLHIVGIRTGHEGLGKRLGAYFRQIFPRA